MATRKSSRPPEGDPKRKKGTARAQPPAEPEGTLEPDPGGADAPPAAEPRQADQSELALLGEQIRYHERAYRDAAPEVSDAVFDELMERYTALADNLGLPATERLDAQPGADHTEGFATVEHRVAMLSLEKLSPARRDSKGESMALADQLRAWYERRRKELELAPEAPLGLLVEPKIDGISVSLTYSAGKLVRAVTRGDGRKGDDITRQARESRAVPTELTGVTGELEIRGELYWPRPAFEAYNRKLKELGDKPIINPRNGCAGLMKRKDPTGLGEIGVRSFMYQVAWAEGVRLPSKQSEIIQWLKDAGATVYASEICVAAGVEDALAYCETYQDKRQSLEFDIDGMVIKIEDLAFYRRLGSTGHHPHWGIAYKFPPEQKPTRLKGIHVQVGKSGSSRPWRSSSRCLWRARWSRARRSTTSSSSSAKTCAVGDTVLVEKAGEIIRRWSASSSRLDPRAPSPTRARRLAPSATPTCSRKRSSSTAQTPPARPRCASGCSTSPAVTPWTSTAWVPR